MFFLSFYKEDDKELVFEVKAVDRAWEGHENGFFFFGYLETNTFLCVPVSH